MIESPGIGAVQHLAATFRSGSIPGEHLTIIARLIGRTNSEFPGSDLWAVTTCGEAHECAPTLVPQHGSARAV